MIRRSQWEASDKKKSFLLATAAEYCGQSHAVDKIQMFPFWYMHVYTYQNERVTPQQDILSVL